MAELNNKKAPCRNKGRSMQLKFAYCKRKTKIVNEF